jgi:hypothetical protein
MATWARPAFTALARPTSAAHGHAGAAQRSTVHGGGAARLPHGGALTKAREMAGETWRGSPKRLRWRTRRRRVARRAWTSAAQRLGGELRGRVRGLARSEARDTGGHDALTGVTV